MGNLREDVDQNILDIAQNASDIVQNTANIAALRNTIDSYDPENLLRYLSGANAVIAGLKVVESASDTGTATVSGSVLTDISKSWIPDQWIGFNILIDGTEYKITDNTATTITVIGSPSSGSQAYTIHGSGTGTVSGSVLTDTNRAWTTNQWQTKWVLVISGTAYPIVSNTATTITVTGTPPSGSQSYTIESMYLTLTAETYVVNTSQNEDYENYNLAYVDAYLVEKVVTLALFAFIQIETADAVYARKDLVYLTKNGEVKVAKGIPSGSPVAPICPFLAISLCIVDIAANETYMENSNLTDSREYINFLKVDTTGTTASTFHIDSDNSGPKLKNNSGLLEVRNAADSDYANLKANLIYLKNAVKGDLIVGDGSGTLGLKNVGNKGKVLVPDSAQSDGWRYESFGRKNILINPQFAIQQRAGPFAYDDSYSLDRWGRHVNFGIRSQQVVTGPLGGLCYALRTTGDGAHAMYMSVGQGIPTIDTIATRGCTLVLSGYIRFSAASWSVNPGQVYVSVGYTSVTVDAAFSSTNYAASGNESVAYTQGALPTTWSKFEKAIGIPVTANNLVVYVQSSNGATYAVGDWFELAGNPGPQLEIGCVATEFERRSYAQELLLCQHYYFEDGGLTIYENPAIFGVVYSTTLILASRKFPVEMRVAPSISISLPEYVRWLVGGGASTSVAWTTDLITKRDCRFDVTIAAGPTVGSAAVAQMSNTLTARIKYSAEL